MYNRRARYNRTRFNGGAAEAENRYTTAIAGLVITGRIRAGTVYSVGATASIAFAGRAAPSRARVVTANPGISIVGYANGIRSINPSALGGCSFSGVAKAQIHIRGGFTASSSFVTYGRANAYIHLSGGISATGGGRMIGSMRLRRKVVLNPSYSGVMLLGTAEIGLQAAEKFTLTVTLLPGEEIVVDTANYLVTIDGVNAMSAHSGAWPQLKRGSVSIEVIANGATENKVIFQERWM